MTDVRFCWNELLTRDPAAARRFYETVMGWTAEDCPVGGLTYTVFKDGDAKVAGMMMMPAELPAEVPAHWFSYIAVPDVAEAVAKLRQTGGTVVRDTFTVGDFGRAAIVADPTGGFFGFWQCLKEE